ncbi:hypothetical protein F383_20311 [Gossypium arboreum]|uniref:Uncharacterized protein n=1 Tax=Gossypium arboreum TaxID=29729 RepID=A0A0B0NQN7_GOSAR|nr:hypothetical protein F383_20311 [Gossypium arboreum]
MSDYSVTDRTYKTSTQNAKTFIT